MSTRETQETTHTPGPWEVRDFDEGEISIVHKVEGGTSEIAVVQLDEFDEHWSTVGRADAALIAAAPDLLSLVRRFVAHPSGAWHPERHAAEEMELMADARAAIARATHTDTEG